MNRCKKIFKFCIEKTNFTEDQIIDWFKRFKRDCPDGRLTRDGLRSLFRQAFPEGTDRPSH
jgi:neurocalcin delta